MSFQGPATVVDDNGHRAEMDVKITVHGREPLDWSARGTTAAPPGNLSGPAALCLADGAEARVLVQNVSFAGRAFIVTMLGAGGLPS